MLGFLIGCVICQLVATAAVAIVLAKRITFTANKLIETRQENSELIVRFDVLESYAKSLDREVISRISALEEFAKESGYDSAIDAIEVRIARLENKPVEVTATGGRRRGGSSWASHQAAAANGAVLNGLPHPLPKPGVS